MKRNCCLLLSLVVTTALTPPLFAHPGADKSRELRAGTSSPQLSENETSTPGESALGESDDSNMFPEGAMDSGIQNPPDRVPGPDDNPTAAAKKQLEDYHRQLMKEPPRVQSWTIRGSDTLHFPAGWTGGTEDPTRYSTHQNTGDLRNRVYSRQKWRERNRDDKQDDVDNDDANAVRYGHEDSVMGLRGVKQDIYRNQPGSY